MSSSRAQAQSRACHDRKYLLTLIKMGFLIVVFADWGGGGGWWGQSHAPSYFKKK